MTADTLKAIHAQLDQWEDLGVSKKLGEAHPDTELATVSFGVMTAAEFNALSARALEQFRIEFDSSIAVFLPETFQFEHVGNANQIQNYRLTQQLSQYIHHVNTANWSGAANNLRALVGYQISNGFWGKSERKLHHPGRERLMELVSDLESRLGQLSETQRSLTELLEEEHQRHQKLNQNIDTLQEEASSKVNTITETAADLTTKVETCESTVSELLERTKTQTAKIDSVASDYQDTLEEANKLLKTLNEKNEELDTEITNSSNLLKTATDAHTFIEGKREEIVDLTGKAAGAALGGKFESRRRRQAISTGWWLFGVIVFTLATGGWIYFVSTHTVFQNDALNAWQAFAWKFGLISPAAFLLGYAARQYGKERSLEEEYAYRSVVAMTLNAFADQIDLCKEGSGRAQMISGTVEKLYQLPVTLTRKQETNDDTFKSLLSYLKEFKDVTSS